LRGAGFRSCIKARSFPSPCGAARVVLQDDALGLELLADAISGGEIAVLLRLGALGDAGFDASLVGTTPEPFVRSAGEQPKQRGACPQGHWTVDCLPARPR